MRYVRAQIRLQRRDMLWRLLLGKRFYGTVIIDTVPDPGTATIEWDDWR